MPSSYDNELGVELQAAGENLNTWGQPKLNNALNRLVKGVAGLITVPLTGDLTLSSSNTSTAPADYQARHGALKFTGTGDFQVTVPSTPKAYNVWNACAGVVTLTTGVGGTAAVAAGEVVQVLCDGAHVRKVKVTDLGGARLSGIGAPTAATDAASKAYVDGLAFAAADLPGQGPASVGRFVRSDGATASWEAIAVAEVAGAAPLASPAFAGEVSVTGDASISGAAAIGGDAAIGGALEVAGGLRQAGGSVAGVTAVAAQDINLADGDFQTKSIAANTAFTISGLVAGKAQVVILVLIISSNAVPSFPEWVKFGGGINFLAGLGNGEHWLSISTVNGGGSGLCKLVERDVL